MAKATAGEIVYKVTGDSSQLKKELTSSEQAVKKFTDDGKNSVNSLGSAFSKIGPMLLSGLAVGAVVEGFK